MQDNTKSPIGSLCFSVSIVIVMLTEAAIQCPHRCKLASPHSMDDFTLNICREQGAGHGERGAGSKSSLVSHVDGVQLIADSLTYLSNAW